MITQWTQLANEDAKPVPCGSTEEFVIRYVEAKELKPP
jgi:hypothetical protein